MTDSSNKPIDNSKEELTEAELAQVAGGVVGGFAMVEKTHTQPESKTKFGSVESEKTHPKPEVRDRAV
jgi:hypothetical protein